MRMDKVRLNLYVDETAVREARASGLNISRFLEDQLKQHAQSTRAQRWLEQNRDAIRAYNERVERDGPWNKDLIRF